MNKKTLVNLKKATSSILTFLMLVSSLVSAPLVLADALPTLTIGSQSAANEATINVPLNASNFADIGGMDFNIQYNSSLLTYTGYDVTELSGTPPADFINLDGNVIRVSWPQSVPLNVSDGSILTLNFTVISSDTIDANLTFVGSEEMTDSAGDVIASSFVDGVISLNPAATLSSIAITSPASRLIYAIGDSLDITGLVVTGTYSDDSTDIETITTENITGFDSSVAVNDQILTITVNEKTTTYTVDVIATPNITILSPNGGESFFVGSDMTIDWLNTNYRDSIVSIYLYRSDTIPGGDDYNYVAEIGSQIQPNDGTETWTIPSTITPGANYFIRISLDVQDPQERMDTNDDSDAPFSIVAPLSSAKNIISFSFPEGNGVIAGTDIAVDVPFGTNITELVPTIVVSPNASVDPSSGAAQDFTSPVTYTVTAENSSTQTYTVTVTVSDNPDIALLAGDKASLVDDSIKGENADLYNVTSVLANPLPSVGENGSTITWASSNTEVVSDDGQTINRPAFADGDATVNLTATLTKGIVSDTKAFTLTVLKLPASTIATITSEVYAVSAEGTGGETIINVPFSTSKSDFLNALTKGEDNQVLDDMGVSDPVVTGNILVVTAQDGVTMVTYTITVSDNPDIALVSADRDALLDNAIKGENIDLLNITSALANPLPSVGENGSTITWASSNTAVVSDDGQTVNRPAFADGDIAATMTASIAKGVITQTKVFTLNVLKLPASTIATITSETYTVSAEGTDNETITDIPFGTSKATLLTALVKGETNQTWVDTDISDPVITGNTLVVTAQDGVTIVVYTLTVTPDLITPTGSISNISENSYLKGTVTIDATASDVGSGVAKVEFWYASVGTKIGEDETAPYSIDWDTTQEDDVVPDGDHSLFIKVYDNAGNSYQSDGIAITVDNTAPTVTKLGDDSIDLVLAVGDSDLVFSEVLSDNSKTAVQNALTAGADKTLTYSWAETTLTITATEITTFSNDVIANVSDLAGNTARLLLVDSSLVSTQTVPNESGAATVDNTTPQVVITDPTQAVTVTVGDGTTSPTVDVGSFISGGTGTIPSININSSVATVAIPGSTTVTSTNPTWNGVIAGPTATTITLPQVSGETRTLGVAIEIGFTGAKLSFDRGVRLLLPGQAGKRAGYVIPGATFTEVTNICEADNQTTGDALAADGDCKLDVGSDLVIWTKHFTVFASFSSVTNGGGGGGGGYYRRPPIVPTTEPVTAPGKVLGATTQLIADGTMIKLRGKNTYYLVVDGKRKAVSFKRFKKWYSNKEVVTLDRDTILQIPRVKRIRVSRKKIIVEKKAEPSTFIEVAYASVRIRDGIGYNANIIDGVKNGQRLEVLEEKDGWYRIVLNGDTVSWIEGKWVKKIQ